MPTAILFLDGTTTITATEGVTNVVCTFNQHVSLWYNGRVTTTIDLFNTGYITTFDNHVTLLAGSWQIISLVTTTID